MLRSFLAFVLGLLRWALWILCVLLILPLLLSVPGRPAWWEFALYIATLGAVVGYALLFLPLSLIAYRARRQGAAGALISSRRTIGVLATAAIITLATAFGQQKLREAARPALTAQEYAINALSNAILHEDTGWLRRLVADGVDVDQPISLGSTAAVFAAQSESWPVVLFLLEHGADPDRADDRGDTVRTLADGGKARPRDPQSATALASVRAMLNQR